MTLFTDGLVERRDRDIDSRVELRRSVRGCPGRAPEAACQADLDALLPERPADDVALLIARTPRVDPGSVTDWDVPADPAAVSGIRAQAARVLEGWGLEHVPYATELIVSELVTHAIRTPGCDHRRVGGRGVVRPARPPAARNMQGVTPCPW